MSGLFGGPDTPTPKAPAPMPDDNSPSALEARRKASGDILSRAGRSSTILTTPGTRTNSDSYASKTLGAA